MTHFDHDDGLTDPCKRWDDDDNAADRAHEAEAGK